jgi:hypothetical protein
MRPQPPSASIGAGQQIGTFFYIYFGSGLDGGLVMDAVRQPPATQRNQLSHRARRGQSASVPTTRRVGLHFNILLPEQLRRGTDGARSKISTRCSPRDIRFAALDGQGLDRLTGLVLAVEYLLDRKPSALEDAFPTASSVAVGASPDSFGTAHRRQGDRTASPRHGRRRCRRSVSRPCRCRSLHLRRTCC